MGAALFPVFERDLPGLDYMDFFGKGLARASNVLNTIAERLGVTSLYCLVDCVETMRSLHGSDPEEDEEEVPELLWFPAEEGLRTVNALLDYVTQNPENIHEPEGALYDLERLKLFLNVAQEEGIRFRMDWDI